MIDECGSFKDPIVSFVSINKNAMVKCQFFKFYFALIVSVLEKPN